MWRVACGVCRFAKHRKGFFSRFFRTGQHHDEKKLLSFKKSMIKKALLKQNRDLDAEAVQNFKSQSLDRSLDRSLARLLCLSVCCVSDTKCVVAVAVVVVCCAQT